MSTFDIRTSMGTYNHYAIENDSCPDNNPYAGSTTSSDYFDLESRQSSPSSSSATAGISLCTRAAKKPRKNRDPTRIRRPRNAFIVFRSSFILAQKQNPNAGPQNELSKQAALVWNVMDDEAKRVYQDIAEEERTLHRLKYPDYKYSPQRTAKPKNAAKAKRVAASPSPTPSPTPTPSPLSSPSPVFQHHEPQAVLGFDVKPELDQPLFSADNILPPSYQYGDETFMCGDYSSESSYYMEETLPFMPQGEAEIDWSAFMPAVDSGILMGDALAYGLEIDNPSYDVFNFL